MTDARWLDDREQHAWRSLNRMQRELGAVLERSLVSRSGLSGADYQVLAPLSESPDGRLRARDLARGAGWEKSRLSHQMRRMEQRGLIEREDCATDARGAYVRLTAAGRLAIETAAPQHVEEVRRLLFDRLSPAEVELLAALSDRVLAGLAGDVAAACTEVAADPDGCAGEPVEGC